MVTNELHDDFMAIFNRMNKAQEAMQQYMQRAGSKLEKEVLDQILLLMQAFGIDLDRLAAEHSLRFGKSRKKLAPKYFNPENPAQTWAGRGSMPAWMKIQLESGCPRDELRVNSQNSIIATHF